MKRLLTSHFFFWREISRKFWKQPASQQKNSKLWKTCRNIFTKECFFLCIVEKKGHKDNLFLDTQILVMLAKERFMPFQEDSLIIAEDTGRGHNENLKQK